MWRLLAAVALFGPTVVYGQATPQSPPPANQVVTCTEGASAACIPSPTDRRRAAKEFKQGIKARDNKHLSEAFEHFKTAAYLAPRDIQYITAREYTRQQLVFQMIHTGNQALQDGKQAEALAAFRSASELDPTNDFAKQRVKDALPEQPTIKPEAAPFEAAAAIRLKPSGEKKTIHFRGGAQQLLETLARTYGLVPFIDESVLNRPIRFDLEDATWEQASDVAARMTKTFWTPLASNQIFFAADEDQYRRSFQTMGMRTFFIPNATTPQELNEFANTLRVLFDIRYITPNPAVGTITVRAPQQMLDAATAFLAQLESTRPQVLLDVKVFEVSRSFAQQVGVDLPLELQVFNLPTVARTLLGNQNVQDIINQLIASGVITQGNSAAIAALIAQQLNASSLLTGTLLTFGGGITLTGVPVPPATLKFSVDDSSVRSLQTATLRATHGSPAILKIGSRVPVINATFSPVINSAAILQGRLSGGLVQPVPSFNFEDVGLDLKATPQIRRTGDVALELEMQVRALSTQSFNNIPVITNREYKGSITSKDGESIVIAGSITQSEQRSLKGLPLLSRIPAAGRLFSTDQNQKNNSELLIVLTPRIVSQNTSAPAIEVPVPRSTSR